VNERKAARLSENPSAKGTQSGNKAISGGGNIDKYSNAMSEMMERIKSGNVGLRKPARRVSSADSEVTSALQKNFLFDFKSATLGRSNNIGENKSNDKDMFDSFRKDLTPVARHQATRTRRISAPDGGVNFRTGLRPVKLDVIDSGEEVDKSSSANRFVSSRFPYLK